MEPKLVEIYRAKNTAEACLLRDRLADQGIEAFVTNDMLNAGKIDLLGWPTDPCVLVREPEAVRARELATAFDREMVEHHPAEPLTEEGPVGSWPVCPKCGARRMTACPACHYAGTDFQPGDPPLFAPGQAEEEAPPALAICPECDEPFAPEYLGRCEWCGHVFDAEAAARQQERPLVDETVNSRVGIVVAILAVLAAGLVSYLAYLFSARPAP